MRVRVETGDWRVLWWLLWGSGYRLLNNLDTSKLAYIFAIYT